jgi:hypothetical protein
MSRGCWWQASNWGSSFYSVDGIEESALVTHDSQRPRNQNDGKVGNAMCKNLDGSDTGVCDRVTKEMFRRTLVQIADSKYSQHCNGHGTCDTSIGFCICDRGWRGMNCSEPEVPCTGVQTLHDQFGSISTGYGRDRKYGLSLNCTWVIAPQSNDKYGLPTALVLTYFDTEAAFDVLALYEGHSVDPSKVITTIDGKYPRPNYAMPQLLLIPTDKGVTVNFNTDATTSMSGFNIMFGTPMNTAFFDGLRNPLTSAPCNRKFSSSEAAKCANKDCDNCGLSLNERADMAFNGELGTVDSMCYMAARSSTENLDINDPNSGTRSARAARAQATTCCSAAFTSTAMRTEWHCVSYFVYVCIHIHTYAYA